MRILVTLKNKNKPKRAKKKKSKKKKKKKKKKARQKCLFFRKISDCPGVVVLPCNQNSKDARKMICVSVDGRCRSNISRVCTCTIHSRHADVGLELFRVYMSAAAVAAACEFPYPIQSGD
jgi:hypothetical protein